MGSDSLSWRVLSDPLLSQLQNVPGSALICQRRMPFRSYAGLTPKAIWTVSSRQRGSFCACPRLWQEFSRSLAKPLIFTGDTLLHISCCGGYVHPFAAPGAQPSALLCWHLLSLACWGSPWLLDDLVGRTLRPLFSAFGSGRKCCRRELRSARSCRFIRRRGGDCWRRISIGWLSQWKAMWTALQEQHRAAEAVYLLP